MRTRQGAWWIAPAALLLLLCLVRTAAQEKPQDGSKPPLAGNAGPVRAEAEIRRLDPPAAGFFSKELDYEGIPIKAHAVVADAALFAARDRLALLLKHLPDATYNLQVAGAELHIIGKDQVTSDLPEHQHLKGKPFDGNLTVDQRTRGLGGLLTSCGEENLLKLPGDRYRGRDICLHEFAHNLQDHGLSDTIRQKIREQYRKSLDKGLWTKAYAATNVSEYFAELSMWYFGTHGDLGMTGPKPANGPDGLKQYDPDAYALLDDIYMGRLTVPRVAVVELDALPPNQEKDKKSPNAEARTSIRFLNRTSRTLKLYWLDNDGKRKPYGTLAPEEPRVQSTFVGQFWLIADENDQALALYTAAEKRGLATIREKQTPKEK